MSDRIDEHVAAVLTAIDVITPDAPPLPSTAPRSLAVRRPLLVGAGAFILVLVTVGLAVLLPRIGPGVAPPFDAVALVPVGHAAIEMNASDSVEEASAVAEDRGFRFVCGTFPVDGGATSACMVSDDGVVGVIAFNPSDDMEYVLSAAVLDDDVTVPVDDNDVFGIEAPPGRIALSIRTGDTVIGTVTFGA